jgi:hypothetical protein
MHGARIDRFILNDAGEPVVEPDLLKWGRWFETGERQVAQDEIGEVMVSTVFLGIDHGFGFLIGKGGPPILWETMVFGAPEPRQLFGRERMVHPDLGEAFDALSQRRYASRVEALQGHAEVVAAVHRLRALLPGGRPDAAQDPPADEANGGPGDEGSDRLPGR